MTDIDEVWLFITIDETGEHVCATRVGASVLPLMAADEDCMTSLIPLARKLASVSGKSLKLIRLGQRTELMTVYPNGGNA
jgi:hypothetical protein